MDVESVDPRDSRWETGRPTYRVHFWGRSLALPDMPSRHLGYFAREYRVRGATDVHEVIRWADRSLGADETYTLYVESRDSGAIGLIRLAGTDPTRASL